MDKNQKNDENFLQSRRDFLKKLIALGITAGSSSLFFGEKQMKAAEAILSNGTRACSTSYDCAGGGGKCGTAYDCAGQGAKGRGKCGSSYECAGGGGKCGTAYECAGS